MKHSILTLYLPALLLWLFASCDASILHDTPPQSAAPGQPVEITIGPYPSHWEGTEPGTRAIIDPDNPLKTNWEKGDKLWIRMEDYYTPIPTTGTATYDGQTWNHNLRWPVGATRAFFYAWYIGDHEPNDETFADTDMLLSYCDASAGQPVNFGTFGHYTNRLIITGQSLDDLYLSGKGFMKYELDAGYYAIPEDLDGKYLRLSGTSTTVYLGFDGTESRQLYIGDGKDYTLISDLNFSSDAIRGHTYTIKIGEGGITAEGMNEEQKKAREKVRFLAWAAECNEDNYQDFELKYDIDLTGVDWKPVWFENSKTFDGGGHTISGLKVTQVNDGYAGLFGYVNNVTIHNLHVSGTVDVPGLFYTGGIVGYALESKLENVSFSGNVISNNTVGGIASAAGFTTFINCHYKGPDDLKFLGEDVTGNNIFNCSPWDYEP